MREGNDYQDVDQVPRLVGCLYEIVSELDAVTRDGKLVQVKATQGTRTSLGSESEHLIVLLLHRDGSAEEVFNGPGNLAWHGAGPMQKTGQCAMLALSTLRRLMIRVPERDRLPTVNAV